MTIHTWWIFAITVFLLSATPGPNMLHVLSRSVHWGLRRSISAMAGCLTALFVVLIISAAGMGALLSAIPGLFEVIKYLGAGYLIYLGIAAWRARKDHSATDPEAEEITSRAGLSRLQLYRGGFFVGISNPKLLLFTVAFFPQFITLNAEVVPQYAILILTFMACESFWLVSYGLGGHGLSRILSGEKTGYPDYLVAMRN
ncbi:LysE family translocator [Carnimonas nigrificans]|uniref:LysE family translocator n=1 Tax=Carnimonas nigrificans TaxID=64323 RepID=UPI0004725807|nr:LysE family translocator [Carnimonas nigrificans]